MSVRRHLRRAGLALALAATALVLAVVLVGSLARVRAGPALAPAPDGFAPGAWHVHTVRSDGRGTEEQVVAAAVRAGLRFVVLADHNQDPRPPRRVAGVLVVDAVEVSAQAGHVVALGVDAAPPREVRGAGIVDWIHAHGGEAYLAHPINRRQPWRDEAAARAADGLEVFSFDSAFRGLLAAPARLVPALLAMPLAPTAAVGSAVEPPADAFALARRLRGEGAPAVRLCAHDAHGFPPYESLFGTMRLELAVDISGEPSDAARALRRAIREGMGRCRFAGTDAGAPDPEGVTLARAPGLLAGMRPALSGFTLLPPQENGTGHEELDDSAPR